MGMARKTVQAALAIMLAIGVIGGGALLLRGGLARARQRADENVVIETNDGAAEGADAPTSDGGGGAPDATGSAHADASVPPDAVATREPDAARDIAYGTIKILPSNAEPSAMDIPCEDAVRQALAALDALFDVSLDGAAVEASYFESYGVYIDRPNWSIHVQPVGGNESIWYNMDSVTGRMFHASLFRKGDTANWQERLADDDTDWNAFDEATMADRRYEDEARAYMAEHLPQESVRGVKNWMMGSMSAYEDTVCTIDVAVDVEGGAGYVLWMGIGTHEVLFVQYYPDGVPYDDVK